MYVDSNTDSKLRVQLGRNFPGFHSNPSTAVGFTDQLQLTQSPREDTWLHTETDWLFMSRMQVQISIKFVIRTDGAYNLKHSCLKERTYTNVRLKDQQSIYILQLKVIINAPCTCFV